MCYIIHPAPQDFNAPKGGVRQNLQKTSRLVSLTMIEFINGGVICFLNSYCEIMQAKPMNPAKFAETNKLWLLTICTIMRIISNGLLLNVRGVTA